LTVVPFLYGDHNIIIFDEEKDPSPQTQPDVHFNLSQLGARGLHDAGLTSSVNGATMGSTSAAGP